MIVFDLGDVESEMVTLDEVFKALGLSPEKPSTSGVAKSNNGSKDYAVPSTSADQKLSKTSTPFSTSTGSEFSSFILVDLFYIHLIHVLFF